MKRLQAVNILLEEVLEIYGPTKDIVNISNGLFNQDRSVRLGKYSVIKLTLEESTDKRLKNLIESNGGVHMMLVFPTRIEFLNYLNQNTLKS